MKYLAFIPVGVGSFWGTGESPDKAAQNAVQSLKRDGDYEWFVEHTTIRSDRISVYDISDLPLGEVWYADCIEGIMRSDTDERIERHSMVSLKSI